MGISELKEFFVEASFIYEIMVKYLNGLWSCQLPTHTRGLYFVILVLVWEWDQFNVEMSIIFSFLH